VAGAPVARADDAPPGAAGGVVALGDGGRFGVRPAADDQDAAVPEEGRSVRVARVLQGRGGGPGVGGRVVQLRRREHRPVSAPPADHQHAAVGQAGRGVAPSPGAERRGRRPAVGREVVAVHGRRRDGRRRDLTADDEDAAISQEGRGVPGARPGQGRGGGPGVGGRVVEERRGHGRPGRGPILAPADEEHPPVGQEGLGRAPAERRGRRERPPGIGRGVIAQLVDQHRAVAEGRGRGRLRVLERDGRGRRGHRPPQTGGRHRGGVRRPGRREQQQRQQEEWEQGDTDE